MNQFKWPRIMNMHIPTNTPVAKTPMEATDSLLEEAKEMVDQNCSVPILDLHNRTYPYWLGLDQKDSEFISPNEGDAFRMA